MLQRWTGHKWIHHNLVDFLLPSWGSWCCWDENPCCTWNFRTTFWFLGFAWRLHKIRWMQKKCFANSWCASNGIRRGRVKGHTTSPRRSCSEKSRYSCLSTAIERSRGERSWLLWHMTVRNKDISLCLWKNVECKAWFRGSCVSTVMVDLGDRYVVWCYCLSLQRSIVRCRRSRPREESSMKQPLSKKRWRYFCSVT